MKVEEAVQITKNHLEILSNQVKDIIPTTICNINETTVNHSSPQLSASFLKTKQSDTLDLCILFKRIGLEVVVSGDLVKGGSGKVLSEMPQIILPSHGTEDEWARLIGQIKEYIFFQKDKILQELH